MKIKDNLRKVFSIVEKIEEISLIVFLAVMMFVILLQVIFRFVLNSPLLWSEELSRYLLIWMGMAGIGYGINTNTHVKMEYFFNKMPVKLQKVLQVCFYLLIIAGFIIIAPNALDFCKDQSGISSSSLPINLGWVFASLCVGILFVIIHCIEGIINVILEEN